MTNHDRRGLGPVLTRKQFLAGTSALAVTAGLGGVGFLGPARAAGLIERAIPSSGEKIPIVGIGTARVFDVGDDDPRVPVLKSTLEAFLKGGGKVMDTSPTYGRAEALVGRLVAELQGRDRMFFATKISSEDKAEGEASAAQSFKALRTDRIDLLQVHNIKDVRTQLATIRALKEAGKVRYVGITISNRRSYDDFFGVMKEEKLDFVQVNYSLGQPQSAKRLLPTARDRGLAVLVNRPFWLARLFRKAKGKRLPPWAAEFGAASWAQFFLKFILGHPAVTCAIPGTNRPEYMIDNLGAAVGPMPDEKTQARMLAYWQSL